METVTLTLKVLFFTLSAVCFASFAWAIKTHFIKSENENMPKGMKLITTLGFVSFFWQIFGIFIQNTFFAPISIIGGVLYLVSLALFWWTIKTTQRQKLTLAFSRDKPRFLLQSGPYRFIRHPFYTAYSLFWLAGLLAAQQWWLIATILVMCSLYYRAAKLEENKFVSSDTLQHQYKLYQMRTGMFFPKLINRSS